MKKEFYNLFPIPLLYINNFLSEKEISIAKNFIFSSLDKVQHHGAIFNGNSTHSICSTFDILKELEFKYEDFKKVKENLNNFLFEFSNYSSIKFQQIKDSWFNIQKKISFLHQHNHLPGSNISGAIYIDVGPNSSPITFYDNFNNKFSVEYDNYNLEFSFNNYKFYPKAGDLVIFPSYLDHGSDDINFYEGRTVISFNAS